MNVFPYLEKHERRESSVPLRRKVVILKLSEFYTGCGRNITTDNFVYNRISKKNYASWNYSEKQKGATKIGETDKGQYESFLNNHMRTKLL